MRFIRSRRFRYVVLGVSFSAAAALGWAWATITPSIGEPFVAAAESDVPTSATTKAAPVPRAKLWSFGFVGDTHTGLADGTVDEIFARFDEADLEFVLHLGDMVDVGAADGQWDQLSELAWSHRVRLMPVVGNHDPHRGYPSDRGEIRIRQYFPHLPETFYSFHHRGLSFVMLNSERSLVPGSEQATFLARQLARQPLTTLVCLHRPVFTCGKRDLPFLLSRRLCLHRALTDSSAVCVLTGHNHYYERTRPLDGITYLVSGGGTANQYGKESPDARTAKFVAGRSHYGLVDVFGDHLAVRVVDLAGIALDEFDLPTRPEVAGNRQAAAAWSRSLPAIATLEHFQLPGAQSQRASSGDGARVVIETNVAARPMPRAW